MKTLLISLVVLVWVTGAAASEAPPARKADVPTITSPPWFSYLVSSEGNSILTMECDGEKPFKDLYCHFTKIMFTSENETERRKRRVEAIADLDQMTRMDMAGFVTFFAPDDIIKLDQRIVSIPPEKWEYVQDFIAVYNELSAARVKARPKTAPTKPDAAKEDACTGTLQGFDVAFKYEGRNRWVSKTGPAGMCNVVRMRTLENTPDSPKLWKYTEERVAAIAEDFCAGVQINKPVIFSWDAPHELSLNCRHISFGSR